MASVLRSAVATRPAAAVMRRAAPSCPRFAALVPTRLPVSTRPSARRIVARAADQADDFDAVLMKYAEKWEKAENKPVIIGYLAAAFAALFTAEWLIHLPALDFLLGGPVQLVGLFTLPYLIVRWGIDGVKPGDDVDQYTAAIISKLPGLKKE